MKKLNTKLQSYLTGMQFEHGPEVLKGYKTPHGKREKYLHLAQKDFV